MRKDRSHVFVLVRVSEGQTTDKILPFRANMYFDLYNFTTEHLDHLQIDHLSRGTIVNRAYGIHKKLYI